MENYIKKYIDANIFLNGILYDVEKSHQTTPFKAWTFRASKKLNKPRLSSRGYTQSFFDDKKAKKLYS